MSDLCFAYAAIEGGECITIQRSYRLALATERVYRLVFSEASGAYNNTFSEAAFLIKWKLGGRDREKYAG